jgi:methionyl-tRNA formyltransferase
LQTGVPGGWLERIRRHCDNPHDDAEDDGPKDQGAEGIVVNHRTDLFLGSDIGLWVLGEVSPVDVLRVYTLDPKVALAASERGFELFEGNANVAGLPKGNTGFSVHYPVVFTPAFLSGYSKVYNLHPGYLPWGRGFYPIFWAIWEQSPAGATLHEVTERVDEGPVVAQLRVDSYPSDLGRDLFLRVREAEKAIFRDCWEGIREGRCLPSRPQGSGGTRHSRKEFFHLKEQANWREMRGEDLMRLIRALTFEGYTGLEVRLGESRYHVRLERQGKE